MNTTKLAETYYDLLAAKYDEATLKDGAWTPPTQVARALERMSQDLDSVLIIGVGTGHDLSALPYPSSMSVEGIDVSQKMLDICETKYPWVKLHYGDFMTFCNFAKPKYDLLVCSGTLEFIPNFAGFFERCASLLSPEGALLLTYEPVIYGHQWQKDAEADTLGESAEKYNLVGFKTYRRTIHEYEIATKTAGLSTTEHYAFVSYKKAEVDIIYHFAVCQKE